MMISLARREEASMSSAKRVVHALLLVLAALLCNCESVAVPSAARVNCENQKKHHGHEYRECLEDASLALRE
jgi:hypothetical protein